MWSSTAFAGETAGATRAKRVIEAGTADVRRVPWKCFPAHEAPLDLNPAKPAAPLVNEEVSALRRRLEELTAAIERRAQDAYQEGFRAGDAATRKALEQETRAAVEAMAAAIADAAALRSETIRRAEADTVRLAVEIARRVLHREISVDPSALEALIRAALEKLKNQEILRVRVHPDQEKLVRTCLDHAGRANAIEVTCDAALSRGAASFDIARGSLDASVEAQLREIERGLTDELHTRS
jgi:flagellar assembly protein FliH